MWETSKKKLYFKNRKFQLNYTNLLLSNTMNNYQAAEKVMVWVVQGDKKIEELPLSYNVQD